MPRTRPHAISNLSPRWLELLKLLAKGLTNDEIASALQIARGTVRAYVATLLSQLDVTNRTEAAAQYIAWESRPSHVESVMRRPAIDVLPLLPLGDDSRTHHIAAGLTEDIASLFARWCWFPVVATSSSASARTLGSSIQEIAAQLRARYLVDGTVRHDGEQWRLLVHIDDAETGHQLWTEAYDFPLEALFETRDEICGAVVATAYPVLVARTLAPLPDTRPVEALASWELACQGMSLQGVREPEANAASMLRFRAALARDPQLVLGHYGLGIASYYALLNEWGGAGGRA